MLVSELDKGIVVEISAFCYFIDGEFDEVWGVDHCELEVDDGDDATVLDDCDVCEMGFEGHFATGCLGVFECDWCLSVESGRLSWYEQGRDE